MPQKQLVKLLGILSISLASSCATLGPQVSICVSNPNIEGFDCYSEKDKKSFFLDYKDSDKYIAVSPEDAKALIKSCGP